MTTLENSKPSCSVCGKPADPLSKQPEGEFCEACWLDLIDHDLYIMSLEKEHRRMKNKVKDPITGEYRPVRIIKDFPEIRDPRVALPIIAQLEERKNRVEAELTQAQFGGDKSEIEPLQAELKKIRGCLHLVTAPNAPKSGRVTEDDIQRAKETNVPELAERLGLDVMIAGGLSKCCCPFHDEKTPSMVLYEDHFYCFGCKENGDAIKLYMKIENTDFLQAVRELGRL